MRLQLVIAMRVRGAGTFKARKAKMEALAASPFSTQHKVQARVTHIHKQLLRGHGIRFVYGRGAVLYERHRVRTKRRHSAINAHDGKSIVRTFGYFRTTCNTLLRPTPYDASTFL